MSFRYLSIDERIREGIQKFDYHAAQGQCPKNWRSLVSLSDVRFGIDSYSDSFPAKVFGSYAAARQIAKLGWSFSMKDHGFTADRETSTSALRTAWEKALKTDSAWSYSKDLDTYYRTIKGAQVEVFKNSSDLWVICLTTYNGSSKMGTEYKDVASAKRAVRKMSNLI